MRRSVAGVLLAGVLVLAAAGSAFAAVDAAANRLLAEAAGLVETAKATEAPGERAVLYRRALDALDQIVAQHPSSDAAVKLAAGDAAGTPGRTEIERQWHLARAEECLAVWDRLCLLDIAHDLVVQYETDRFDRDLSFMVIAEAWAKAGAFREAQEAVGDIESTWTRSAALKTITPHAPENGVDDTTRALIAKTLADMETIEDKGKRAWALAMLSRAMWNTEDPIGALRALSDASTLTLALASRDPMFLGLSARDPMFLVLSAGEMAFVSFALDQNEMGWESLRFAELLARKILDPTERAVTLGRLALTELDLGRNRVTQNMIAEATDAMNLIDSTQNRDLALFYLVYATGKSGDVDGALALAGQTHDPYYRFVTLSVCAESQLEQGDVVAAHRTVSEAFATAKDWLSLELLGDILANLALGV